MTAVGDDTREMNSTDNILSRLKHEGYISEYEYRIIIDAGFDNIAQLAEVFKFDRFNLFQNRLRGMSSKGVINITKIINIYLKKKESKAIRS